MRYELKAIDTILGLRKREIKVSCIYLFIAPIKNKILLIIFKYLLLNTFEVENRRP